ncbi:hypothetical protein PIB30_019979 [Stylosanthes scabra]|uniref:Protein TIC 20 n=1 Tax=Stylosanthes scabra TaxID=79078 RepID=A0ABU6Y7D4_9FABA|nr:hypothetical protein [Stylosanthes scabra]
MAPQLGAACYGLSSPHLCHPHVPPMRSRVLSPKGSSINLKKNHGMSLPSISLGRTYNPLFTAVRRKNDTPPLTVASGKTYAALTADSSSLFAGDRDHLSLKAPTSRVSNSNIRGQAYIYHSSGFRIPANAEKPEWWWRTLCCVPYLIALQMSATGFYLEPLLEKFPLFRNLIYYIPGAVNRLPTWFPILYCYLAIVGVVKNSRFPLLFRYHVMMGMLLEIAQQIFWVTCNFLPLIHFKGTLGMYYWGGVALGYILILGECVRCAILGTFVKIPVVSESAFIHCLYGLGLR